MRKAAMGDLLAPSAKRIETIGWAADYLVALSPSWVVQNQSTSSLISASAEPSARRRITRVDA